VSAPTHAAAERARPPAPGPLRPFHFPPVYRQTLSNGLEVVVAEVRSFPVATMDLVLPAGGLSEDEARGGLAALTSLLLESGAGGRSAAEIAEAVDGLGLSLESGITWDVMQSGFSGLRSRMEAGFGILCDLVLRPDFPEHEVDRLRSHRLAALKHTRADPNGVANEVLARTIYAPGTPYARPMSGLESTVSGLTREDVAAFHAARYRPAGSTLVVAGDVSADEVVELAERCLGGWTGAPESGPAPEVREQTGGRRIVVADRPGSVQSAIRVGHAGPERTTPDYFAIQVMNAVLGQMFASRLNMNLRERLGYTYGASSAFTMRRRNGLFVMQTAVQTETTAHSVSEMLGEMRRIREAEVTPQELDDARSYLAGSFPLQLQTTDGVSGKLVALVTYDLPDGYFDSYRENVMGITAADVLEAARRRLHPDNAAIVVAGDAARIVPELEALGEGPVTVLDPDTDLG
jgi:zinc protease